VEIFLTAFAFSRAGGWGIRTSWLPIIALCYVIVCKSRDCPRLCRDWHGFFSNHITWIIRWLGMSHVKARPHFSLFNLTKSGCPQNTYIFIPICPILNQPGSAPLSSKTPAHQILVTSRLNTIPIILFTLQSCKKML
jgi:hypothetical protein